MTVTDPDEFAIFVDIKTELIASLKALVLMSDPFPHFYIRGFLPASLYDQLQTGWPNEQQSVSMSRSKLMKPRSRADNCPTDLRLVNAPHANGKLGAALESPVWLRLSRLLRDPEVIRTVILAFQKWIKRERPDFHGAEELDSEFLVQSDLDGFLLGPHVDTPRKLVSLVLYFAEDEHNSEQGTSLFLPGKRIQSTHPNISKQFIGRFHSEKDFVLQKTMEYLPNSLFGLLVTPRAFHGVREIEGLGKPRRTVLWDIINKSYR